MQILYDIIYTSSSAFLPYLFFEAFLEQKESWKPTKTLLFLLFSGFVYNNLSYILTMPLTFISFGRMLVSGLMTVGMLYIAQWPLHGSVWKKTLLLVLCFVLLSAGELVGTFIFWLLVGQPVFTLLENDTLSRELIILLALAVSLFMIAIVRYFVLKNKRPTKYRFFYRMELFVPFVGTVAISYLASLQQEASLNVGTLVLLLVLGTFYVYNFYYQQTRQYEWREYQQQLDSQQTRFREQHYRELEAHQAEIHTIKHDLKNQLIAMDAYVRAGAAEQAAAQIGSLITQLENRTRFFTENAGVNGLLVQKHRQAQDAGILAEFTVSLPRHTEFADADLVGLAGNILDNAIEACLFCAGRRYIKLDMLYKDGVFLLKSENSTDGKAHTTKTRKTDAVNHGHGLQSIRRVVEKYNGELQYRFGQGHFEIELSMFCPASP